MGNTSANLSGDDRRGWATKHRLSSFSVGVLFVQSQFSVSDDHLIMQRPGLYRKFVDVRHERHNIYLVKNFGHQRVLEIWWKTSEENNQQSALTRILRLTAAESCSSQLTWNSSAFEPSSTLLYFTLYALKQNISIFNKVRIFKTTQWIQKNVWC